MARVWQEIPAKAVILTGSDANALVGEGSGWNQGGSTLRLEWQKCQEGLPRRVAHTC
jgi:hypothetical protein